MTEQDKANMYLACLDRLLAGEKDIGHIEDAEVSALLRLAQNMIDAGYSEDIKIRERLRKQLLAKIYPVHGRIPAGGWKDKQEPEDELTEDELMYVAAGLPKDICPRCGARVDKAQGRCPVCRY